MYSIIIYKLLGCNYSPYFNHNMKGKQTKRRGLGSEALLEQGEKIK